MGVALAELFQFKHRRIILPLPEPVKPISTGDFTEDIFAALEWRRLSLRQDQQLREWAGVRKVAAEDLFWPGRTAGDGDR
ncbi:hypothetical protein ATY30_01580 [Sinorhizobium americanum]|nr:hypothetical protein CO664_26425 [Sinorhizobium sp. NG07B]POH33702.1 hypothetical protein ATY30_01580 [Sinorhizobium americanum]